MQVCSHMPAFLGASSKKPSSRLKCIFPETIRTSAVCAATISAMWLNVQTPDAWQPNLPMSVKRLTGLSLLPWLPVMFDMAPYTSYQASNP